MKYSSVELNHLVGCHRRYLISFGMVFLFCILLCFIDSFNNNILKYIFLFLFIIPNIYLGINTYKLCISMKCNKLVSAINVFGILGIIAIPFFLFCLRSLCIQKIHPFSFIFLIINHYFIILFVCSWIKLLHPFFILSENGLNFWGNLKKNNQTKPKMKFDLTNEEFTQIKCHYQKWYKQNLLFKLVTFLYCIIINNIYTFNFLKFIDTVQKITSKVLEKEQGVQIVIKQISFVNSFTFYSVILLSILIIWSIIISNKNRNVYFLLYKAVNNKKHFSSIFLYLEKFRFIFSYFIFIFFLIYFSKDWIHILFHEVTIDNIKLYSCLSSPICLSILISTFLMVGGTPSFISFEAYIKKISSQFEDDNSIPLSSKESDTSDKSNETDGTQSEQ